MFTRDLARLGKTPKVWAIIIGVLFTPALYAWFNVAAFWDPYENTGNIDVAVVNEDEGGDSDLTGPLDVGDQLVDQLKENDQLGWQFMDADEADDALKSGDVFGTITVPDTFSSDILSMFQGTYSAPTLQYQVNEKQSAISPKITDQGATTLDTTINSVVKEKVAEAVTTQLSESGGDLEGRLGSAQDGAANAFDETSGTMSSIRDEITRIQGGVDRAGPTIENTQKALNSVDTALGDADTALGEVQSVMTEVQTQVSNFTDAATTAYLESTGALAEGTSSANAAISSVTGELERAEAGIDTATREASAFVGQGDRAIGQLQSLIDGAALAPGAAQPLQDALDDLESQNASNGELIDSLEALQNDAGDALGAVNGASSALEDATDATQGSARDLQSSVRDAMPRLNAAINQVNATAGNFSGALGSTRTMLDEANGLLDGVHGQLGDVNDVLDEFAGEVSGIEDGLGTAKTDILALDASSEGSLLDTVTNLDSMGISRFVASPAEMKSNAVFPVEHYGSGMAALFTNLSLWIGGFMLLVIFRTEVDTAGIRRLTVGQAYRGRLMLLAPLALGQAGVVALGDLVLGVQTANAFAFVGTCMLIGLAYLLIIYGLIAAFGHIGRIIAVVLAFLQIPGASGMYPIEMTPGFFQQIYPLLPFTYGIDAMRETIGGFYSDHYWKAMGTLLGMALVALVLGTLLRRWLSNVNMQVNKELEDGGLIINERVEVVGSSYRLTDVIHAMRDRDAFREELDNRWKPLRENYHKLLRLAVIIGLVGVLLLGVIARFVTDQKALVFGIMCLWMLLVVGFIAGLEYVKRSFAHAQELSELPEKELQEAVIAQGAGHGGVIQDQTARDDSAEAAEENADSPENGAGSGAGDGAGDAGTEKGDQA